jgi:hydrogenase maturation factor
MCLAIPRQVVEVVDEVEADVTCSLLERTGADYEQELRDDP